MKVLGQLEKAQLEQIASTGPTPTPTGRVYADITDPLNAIAKMFDGTDWKSLAFGKANIQTFTATGTFTPTAGAKNFLVFITAAGGNGGASTTDGGSGGGGGGGETRIGLFTKAQIGVSQAVTLGAVGANSTFGALLSAIKGGNGASASTVVGGVGGTGGTGGTGGFGIVGAYGGNAPVTDAGVGNQPGANGGSSFLGGGTSGGAQGTVGNSAVANSGGGGGGGGGGAGGSVKAGGNGGTGFCFIIELF